MTERYGNTRVAKIKAAYNDLRAAIRAGDIEAAERALDRYEPWADYVFGAPKIKPLVWVEAGFDQDADLVDKTQTYQIQEGIFWYGAEVHGVICGTNWAAKAAAQADYERRILSALAQEDE